MAFLREAVERQKAYVIEQLMAKGVVDVNDQDLYKKPISEIVQDYERYCQEFERDSQYAIKLTRYNPYQKEEKPRLH
ncbi:hypothetical protein [Gracilibacillus sp. YIM 98692]|uniref:hypothetical protein n=1 Tax=Gracilibacillus sp. YIM 98692 TaxID=2663532 RepID=UPI0013D1BF3F|nr:hypothetical protein [Gracilibacillus sp. YIM 98692]